MIQGAVFLFLKTTMFTTLKWKKAQGLFSFHVFTVICPGLRIWRASPIKDGEYHQLPDSEQVESTKY